MSKLIKFETVDIRKRELFDLIKTVLEGKGWTNVTSNPSLEGIIYHSKGEDGKQNILVNFFDGYDLDNNTKFSTTNYQYFDVRCLISYQPATVNGQAGISVPVRSASAFNRIRMNIGHGSMPLDTRLRVRYHCNANRLILLMSNDVTTHLLMIGKSDRLISKQYTNTDNMVYASYSYRNSPIMSYGVADRDPNGVIINQAMFVHPMRSMYNNEIILSEIGYGNSQEGIKGYLDGVYKMELNTLSELNRSMNEDKIVDDVGNEFTILYFANTDSGSYPCPFTACNLVVCTKKAGE